MTDTSATEIRKAFAAAVNMTAQELERWLASDHSREVGWTREGESEIRSGISRAGAS